MREIRRELPRASTVYLGDSARVPYGGLPMETIRRYTLQCLDYLYREGAVALVLACNSATAAALEAARRMFPVPVVGVIEATARTAAEVALGRVGVVATVATVASGEYRRAIERHRQGLEVVEQPCPGLADRVEAGDVDSLRTRALLERCLRPLTQRGVDTLVLGCTHYGFLRPLVEEIMGPGVRLVESGPPVATSLKAMMASDDMAPAGQGARPTHRLLTTGDPVPFQRMAAMLWPEGLPGAERVRVEGYRGALRRQAA